MRNHLPWHALRWVYVQHKQRSAPYPAPLRLASLMKPALQFLLFLFLFGPLVYPVHHAQAQETSTTTAQAEAELPPSFVLSAAYPNPFNPQTRFTLSVRQAQEVRVEVFNLLGQRVRLLHEGPLEPEREHTFTFEAGDLPSGLYLYRAQSENLTVTRQVTLLK